MNAIAKPNPFARLLSQAAKAPAQTGEVGRIQLRLNGGGVGQVVLADVSSSMSEMAGERTKSQVLRDALAEHHAARIVAFASSANVVDVASLPAPCGGTALHLGLDLAATLRPARTLVISDGRPDDEEKAFRAADSLPGVIDVLYVGPADDTRAIQFMQRLARAGAGRCESHDIKRAPMALAPAVRALLGSGR